MIRLMGLVVCVLSIADMLINKRLSKNLRNISTVFTPDIEILYSFLKKEINKQILVRYSIIVFKFALISTTLVFFAYCLNIASLAIIIGVLQSMSMWAQFQWVIKLREDKKNLRTTIEQLIKENQ